MKHSIFNTVVSLLLVFSSLSNSAETTASTNNSGKFSITLPYSDQNRSIEVHYYRPSSYRNTSAIVLVLPGGGRNGDDYRDAWKAAAEQYNLLVLSPSYAEELYPGPLNYNLGRSIAKADRRSLEDMQLRDNKSDWIFKDFDLIFASAVERFASKQTHYDVFGHSAGGQIAHRLALLYPQTKAHRIVAANSGWYTFAAPDQPFPFGLDAAPTEISLTQSFNTQLIVLLGELDNENETRGHLRRGPMLDKQGAHRLQRGSRFYAAAQNVAASKSLRFRWQKRVVPGVGHSYPRMSMAAAKLLYEQQHNAR